MVILNLIAGFVIGAKAESNKKLIFESNTIARYTTNEFDFRARINSLGLRNREIAVEKRKGVYRILCFGDSYTFGWGVEVEKSWPMQLENILKTKGCPNVEVINCGHPGDYTTEYKKYMSRIVPLLKPDLVLVGVLQLDDLAQLYENKNLEPRKASKRTIKSVFSGFKELTGAFIRASLVNLVKAIFYPNYKMLEVKDSWKSSNMDFINNLKGIQKLRFLVLSDTMQKMFKSGNLNSSILHRYINFPDRSIVFNNPANSATIFAIKAMGNDIKEMKTICKDNGAAMVFINLPTNQFTGHIVERFPSDVLNDYFRANNKIDSMYSEVAKVNDVPYYQLTEPFSKLKDKRKYFYKFDSHPTEMGYAEMANDIGEYLLNNKYIYK